MRLAQRVADHRLQQQPGDAERRAGQQRRRQPHQAQFDDNPLLEIARIVLQQRLQHRLRGDPAGAQAKMHQRTGDKQQRKQEQRQSGTGAPPRGKQDSHAHCAAAWRARNGIKKGLPVCGLIDICTSTSNTRLISSGLQTSLSLIVPAMRPCLRNTSRSA